MYLKGVASHLFITCRKKLFTRNNSQTSFGFISLLQKTLPISKTQQRVCCACLHNLRRVASILNNMDAITECFSRGAVEEHEGFSPTAVSEHRASKPRRVTVCHSAIMSARLSLFLPPHLPPPPSNLLLVHALVLSLRLSSPLLLSCLLVLSHSLPSLSPLCH